MSKAAHFLIALLVVVTHVAASPTLFVADLPQTTDPRSAGDGCCPTDVPASDDQESSESTDCCPDGCARCPLSCCGGSPALLVALNTLTAPLLSSARLSLARVPVPAADPSEIYHPPRV